MIDGSVTVNRAPGALCCWMQVLTSRRTWTAMDDNGSSGEAGIFRIFSARRQYSSTSRSYTAASCAASHITTGLYFVIEDAP